MGAMVVISKTIIEVGKKKKKKLTIFCYLPCGRTTFFAAYSLGLIPLFFSLSSFSSF
jgi:hypothetical protein